jgi:hypothetical protein
MNSHFRNGFLALAVFSTTVIWGDSTAAQADPNIQSTFESIRPEIPLQPEPPKVVRKNQQELEQAFVYQQRVAGIRPASAIVTLRTFKSLSETEQDRELRKVGINPYKTEQRKIEGFAFTRAGYNYESNVFRRTTNPLSDRFLAIATQGVVKFPIKDTDTLVFGAGTASARYDKFVGRDADQAAGSITYLALIGRYFAYAGSRAPSLATTTVLAPSFEVTGFFTPTFESTSFRLYAPGIALEQANIPLSPDRCGTEQKPTFCHTLLLNLALIRNYSDLASQENSFVRFYGEYGWTTPWKGVRFVARATAGFRDFDGLAVSRTDKFGELTARFEWRPQANVTLTAGARYTNQSSTLPAAIWESYGITPSLTATIFF